ncbi:MAG: orotidine-5'-phosphate decarboxylase [Proteobacteria bacterium]|nr:orotidine-5'-phosphate decarboxylase [Pseudomonadota bacterium]
MVALDVDDAREATLIAREIGALVDALKIGSQLFTLHGPGIVEGVRSAGADVFLDLKYHDIPNTVARAVRGASSLGVSWVTVHASGGPKMIQAAREAAGNARILAVTVLTSLGEEDVRKIGWMVSVEEQVGNLALMARESGADGIVCSPREASFLRAALDDECILVTPGIRPSGSSSDDQARVATPEWAIANGADYLVVGRPVISASDRIEAVQNILMEIKKGRQGRTRRPGNP